jgi:hypothetical protein
MGYHSTARAFGEESGFVMQLNELAQPEAAFHLPIDGRPVQRLEIE